MVEWGYSEEEGEEEGGRKRKMFKEEEQNWIKKKMYCGGVRRWR